MQLKTTNDLEEEESWQDKDYDELDTLLVPQLKEICKTYNHPVTGKRKHELIEMIWSRQIDTQLTRNLYATTLLFGSFLLKW